MHLRPRIKIFITAVLVGLVVVAALVAWQLLRSEQSNSAIVAGTSESAQSQTTNQNNSETSQQLSPLARLRQQAATQPAPTPYPDIPFKEMTIPYLRTVDFTSQLTQTSLLSNNANYTSYLANYQSGIDQGETLTINGLLTIPNGNQPEGGWPAIVFVHGYIPPQQYRTTERYVSYVDYLARNGFAVFKIDLRGHGNSEGTPGGAYYSGDYIIDTLSARAALAADNRINANRIGLWGHSMAGNVVFRSMAAEPKIPAGVIWAGAVYTYEDFGEIRISDSSYQRPDEDSERSQRRQELFDTYGRFNPNSDFWQQVPATNYLSDINGAIQINHAVNDSTVPIEYSRNLIDLLDNQQTQFPYELNEYQSGGHDIEGAAFNAAMENTVEWFREYL